MRLAVRPCLVCGIPARGIRCDRHAGERERRRKARQRREYGPSWSAIRNRVLTESPVCEEDGCLDPATEVDHRIPLARGGTHDRGNLRALCKSHHSRKTAIENGFSGR